MITLNLSKHCIQTEVKRLHNRCISRYFKDRGNRSALERELLLLTDALNTFDFAWLRGQYPELSGGHSASVVLERGASKKLLVRINGRVIRTDPDG